MSHCRPKAPNVYLDSFISREHEYSSDSQITALSSTVRQNVPTSGPVKYYDLNTLASNSPIEDSHAEAKVSIGPEGKGGYLFGIYDGHAGAACGQVSTIFIEGIKYTGYWQCRRNVSVKRE